MTSDQQIYAYKDFFYNFVCTVRLVKHLMFSFSLQWYLLLLGQGTYCRRVNQNILSHLKMSYLNLLMTMKQSKYKFYYIADNRLTLNRAGWYSISRVLFLLRNFFPQTIPPVIRDLMLYFSSTFISPCTIQHQFISLLCSDINLFCLKIWSLSLFRSILTEDLKFKSLI